MSYIIARVGRSVIALVQAADVQTLKLQGVPTVNQYPVFKANRELAPIDCPLDVGFPFRLWLDSKNRETNLAITSDGHASIFPYQVLEASGGFILHRLKYPEPRVAR